MLNEIYNLSFKIIEERDSEPELEKIELITCEDKSEKREKQKKISDETRELYKELDEKFKDCNITSKVLRNRFSLGELTKLNEIELDLDEIKRFAHNDDKVVRFKGYWFNSLPDQDY